jgi:hypothetical protein
VNCTLSRMRGRRRGVMVLTGILKSPLRREAGGGEVDGNWMGFAFVGT